MIDPSLIDFYKSTIPQNFFSLTYGVILDFLGSKENTQSISKIFDEAMVQREDEENNIFRREIKKFKAKIETENKVPKYDIAQGIDYFTLAFKEYQQRIDFALFHFQQKLLQTRYKEKKRPVSDVSFLLTDSKGDFIPRFKREIFAEPRFCTSEETISVLENVSDKRLLEAYSKDCNRTPLGVYAKKVIDFLSEKSNENLKRLNVKKETDEIYCTITTENFASIKSLAERNIVFINAVVDIYFQIEDIFRGRIRKVRKILTRTLDTPVPASARTLKSNYNTLTEELGRIASLRTSQEKAVFKKEQLGQKTEKSPRQITKAKKGVAPLNVADIITSPRIELNSDQVSKLNNLSSSVYEKLISFEILLNNVKRMCQAEVKNKSGQAKSLSVFIDAIYQQLLVTTAIQKILSPNKDIELAETT